MKKAYLLSILLIGLLLPFAACSESDEGNEPNPIIGYWYITDNDQIVSLKIDDNGTGEATIYRYTGCDWEINTLPLQYTVADGNIAIKAGNDYTLSGKMGITGASLSITNDDNIFMLTGYDGDNKTIEHLQKVIEENTLTITPDNEIIHESFWNSEADVSSMLAATYIKLTSFTAAQLNLENIRITGKDTAGKEKAITPATPEIEKCWTAAYQAINNCNLIIKKAPEEFINHINEARALRCFIYYNVAHLWGKVPYTTMVASEDLLPLPAIDKENIFDNILSEIASIGDYENSQFGDYGIDASSLLAIRAEIELSAGKSDAAYDILANCRPNFNLSINEEQKSIISVFGNKIALYTPEYVELLQSEAQNAEDVYSLWGDTSSPRHGYWAMLKRTGKAQAVSGCKEHELLMPIPKTELMYNYNLTQNSGY